MAPDGITLVYGENGSGKSGYTRIAKRLCRSLSGDQLRGNVFATASTGPMRVEIRYRVAIMPLTNPRDQVGWAGQKASLHVDPVSEALSR